MQFIHNSFYKSRRVLITGHTGFKGTWLALWLNYLGAEVIGIALDPKTEKDIFVLSGIEKNIIDYRIDIRDVSRIKEIFQKEKPDIIFHLAAQALVLKGYEDPRNTFETNILGTVNILDAIRTTDSVRAAIMVTSDKCYDNIDSQRGYKESDPMGGFDPYSSSKGAAELVINAYRNSFFTGDKSCGIASVRAGNVIGGGDWSENRIIPDCVRSFELGEKVVLRKPEATRPWQHVIEPIGGYLHLAELLYKYPQKYAEAWNFGPDMVNQKTVLNLVTSFMHYFQSGEISIDRSSSEHEARLLSLDISKAINKLKWNPLLDFSDTLRLAADWYLNYQLQNVMELSVNQIIEYSKLWMQKKPE